MIYELRTYEAMPGKMQALQDRFERHSIRFFRKHGMTPVGFWTPVIGEWNNQLIYLLSYPDLAARERSWNAFQNDPEWLAVRAETEKDGPIVLRLHATILNPTGFSDLK